MTEPTDPLVLEPTEAASPVDTTADAANSAAVEPAVRTVYPAGWPAEVLDAIESLLAAAVEALVPAVEGAGYRLRPGLLALLEAPHPKIVRMPCALLSPLGATIDCDRAVALVQSAADARGVWVTPLDDWHFALSLVAPEMTVPDIADEPTVEAPARRRRVS